MQLKTNRIMLLAMVIALVGAPQSAFAYVGPGTGITVIGAALAFIGAVFLAIVGFIWYPIKRLWRFITGRGAKTANTAAGSSSR